MAILRGTYYFNNVAGNYLIAKSSAGITKADGCKISNGQITRYVTESELLTPIEITLVYSSAYINVEQFYGVLSLQKVVLDDSSWTISPKAFELSGLLNIELGTGVYSIGENAFKNSKLKYITSRATTPPQIVNNTFNCIPTGGTLYYPAGSDYSTWLSTQPYYLGYYGWNVSEEGYKIICTYNVTSTTEPTKIFQTTDFINIGIEHIIIEGVTHTVSDINSFTGYTFSNLGLNEVVFVLANNVETLPNIFSSLTTLYSIEIPNNITTIDSGAFNYCSNLTSVTLGANLRYIGPYTLVGNTIAGNLNVFQSCYNLQTINVNENNPYFVSTNNCLIESSNGLKPNNLVVGYGSSVIPDFVTSIGGGAFQGNRTITSIIIPESVTQIGEMAFGGCTSLTSVTIPESVTQIGNYAFFSCSSLNEIIAESETPVSLSTYTFEGVKRGGTLYYPAGSDYSQWLSTSPHYLGYYGWNNIVPEPDEPTYPDGEIVTPNQTKTIVTSGETFQYTIETTNINYLIAYYINFNGNKYLDTIDGFISIEMLDMNNFNITVEENEGDERRCGIYFVYMDYNGNSLTHTLTITQDAKYVEPDEPDSPSIDLEFNNLTAPTGGVTTTLDIETNGVEDIEIIAPEWVEVTDKGGYYEIEVLPNEGTDREGEVIFIGNPNKPNKVQQNIIITQKGNEEMATSIALYKTRLDYTADGGSKYLQVDYVNAQTINAPYCSQSWVTIEQTQSGNTTTNGQPTTQVQYRITMQPSSFARQTNITFSCTDSKGNTVSQNKFMVYQTAPAAAVPTISYNKEGISFDSTGYAEDFSVEVVYENATTILEPVVNGDWITVTEGLPVQGGGSSSENIIVKRYLIEVTATDAYRQGTVIFNASNDIGTANPFIFSVTQLAPVEEEEIVPVVSAYTKTATVKYDGSSTGIAITSLGCSYKNVSSVLTPVISGSWIHLSEGVLQSSSSEDTVVYRYPITFDANDSVERVGYVKFIGTDENGNEYSDSTKITQQAAPVTPDVPEPELPEDSKEVTYSPIWKDVEYVFVSDSEYGIYYDRIHYFQGQMFRDEILLFKGKAYLPPDDSVVKVCINKICQNYMSENPNIFDGAVGYSHSYNEFKLKDSYGTLLHTYRFVNDWSYKELSLGIKTSPIIPNIADGQKLFFSVFATDEKAVKWGMRYYDGTADYNNTEYVSDDFTTVIVPESRQKYVNTFYFGDKSYTSLPRCECKYVLYYMNPYGGYDWLPITGKVVRKDKVEAFVYTKNYNNTTADFGKNRYLSNITVSYNLNTGWLTQEQSDRMWELLESNTVWLHNLDEDRIYPVMITDTNIEHKQKFGKKKRLSYSINVELSQTRERL